jgi:5-hydroxyisourate hydrolase
MSTISTHVLDTALGRPAKGVRVTLEQLGDAGEAVMLGTGFTDDDGRIRDLVKEGRLPGLGLYRMTFGVEEYFAQGGRDAFYPQVEVTFRVADAAQHYHVPLLLSPFGYSTYRGS